MHPSLAHSRYSIKEGRETGRVGGGREKREVSSGFLGSSLPPLSLPSAPTPGWLGSLVLSQHACACACVAVGGWQWAGTFSCQAGSARAVLAACTVLSLLRLKMSTSYLARIFPDLENSIKKLSNT